MLGVGGILRRVAHFAFDRRAVEPIATTATPARMNTAYTPLRARSNTRAGYGGGS